MYFAKFVVDPVSHCFILEKQVIYVVQSLKIISVVIAFAFG